MCSILSGSQASRPTLYISSCASSPTDIFYLCVNRDGSGDTEQIHKHVRAFTGRLCDKKENLMGSFKNEIPL